MRSKASRHPRRHPEPNFSRKLARQIRPTREGLSPIETLRDAAVLIASLEQFRQARPVWDRCAEHVLRAAETGEQADIVEATRCIEVALGKENWLKGHA